MIGLVTTLVGLAYGAAYAGIPFQDPTLQQALQQKHDDLVSQTIALIGIAQFAFGILLMSAVIVARLLRRPAATDPA